MPNNTQTAQEFPLDPILVVNPITRQVLNVQPLVELLHNRYAFDKGTVVEELDDIIEYITRDPQTDEPARKVLACIRTTKALLVAFDSLTTQPLAL
ncbi:hypothetical protein [Hymenobacter sp. BT190]|uniref:hypothetical protein n=1 Tax=Hymenobacter sp. BT190 TaxID=2763505 RepID=UPI001651344F|nr:hypothetical protein [Hymenobacter sp. BT190]MBC6698098.1 hypothetical protein [Hymenobacter sp. BT190]